MSELHLYDFDGTLFRSPMPPAVWDEDWWSDTRSLTPHVFLRTPARIGGFNLRFRKQSGRSQTRMLGPS